MEITDCSFYNLAPPSGLVYSKCSRATLLGGLSLLVAPVKRSSRGMVSANIVEVFDLVNPDDPVLAGVGLLERIEDRTGIRESDTSDTVGCLSRREKGCVVVVGHLVPIFIH